MQGLLLCNKPEGVTSFGVVAQLKRLSGEKRVGHTGTLDPMATGVLPVLFGRATLLSRYLLDAEKTYRATVRLGVETDTLDRTGTVTARADVDVTPEQIDALLPNFCGEQLQTPPAYSALRQNGVRLYTLARQGVAVDPPPRRITVSRLTRTSPLRDGCFTVEVTCSKGTYIRSLCRDIGRALGCGATLDALCRTRTAGFLLEECLSPDGLTPCEFAQALLPAERAVAHFPAVSVTQKQALRFQNGGALDLDRLTFAGEPVAGLYRVYCDAAFLGLGALRPEAGTLAVECLILLREEAGYHA